jgi:predicted PurR-regulated permease PerM
VQELVRTVIPNVISSIGSAVTNFSTKAVSFIANFVTRIPSLLINTIICLIATVFIAVDFERLSAFIRRNLPEKPLLHQFCRFCLPIFRTISCCRSVFACKRSLVPAALA